MRVRVVATYGLQRIKLPELERLVRVQSRNSPTKWFITSDPSWTIFSLKPVVSPLVDSTDATAQKVGVLQPCQAAASR